MEKPLKIRMLVLLAFHVTLVAACVLSACTHEARRKEVELDMAALLGEKDRVAALLARGADPNGAFWDALGSPDTLKLVIEKGANVNDRGRDGVTALHHAARRREDQYFRSAEILIAGGADVNALDNYGSTPLHAAAEAGNTRCAELLLNRGAKINARNDFGETPLYVAVVRGEDEPVAFLVRAGADVNAADKAGRTPLSHARDGEMKKFLTEKGGKLR